MSWLGRAISTMPVLSRWCALLCLFACARATPAADWTASGIVGAGDGVGRAGIELQVPSRFRGALTDEWSWSLRWAGDVAYWWARNDGAQNQSLWEIGAYPLLDFRRAAGSGLSPYAELAIGIHLLSHTRIADRTLSTAFQFGEVAGIGVRFGDREQCGIGLRIHHVSNGGIKEPNSGVTFGELRISYAFE
jgi:Lipid A 3-O-deacylase (PagL)